MKVLHLLRKYDPRAWGGTESAVLELVRGLRGHGVESVVFAPALDAPAPGGDPFLDAGFPVRRYRAFLPVLGLSPEARQRGVAVGGNLASFDAVAQLLREPRVDVFHTHALGRMGGTVATVARVRRKPYVASIHGGYLDLPADVRANLAASTERGVDVGKPLGLLLGARRVVERADAVVTCNPREAELLRARLPAGRVALIPHGVNLAPYAHDHRGDALAAWPSLAGKRLVLCVGRVDPVKNQGFLVDALPGLRRAAGDAVLVLVGAATDAAYAAALDARVTALGLEGAVLRTGGLRPGDPRLVGLYQLARLVALPSLSETFGIVIVEAWAAGTPVLASRTSGALQLIAHGETGALHDHGDGPAFEREAARLLSDDALRARITAAGGARARAEFSSDAVAARFVALYEGVRAQAKP